MQKHIQTKVFSFILGITFLLVPEFVSAGIISLPRYTGEFAYRTNSGGRDKTTVTCASRGGVEKGANQTCTGAFTAGGKTCYKECRCNTSVYKYTEAAHKGDGKLCASLSNACTDSTGTRYSGCTLNACNKQNSEWIGANNKTTYTSKNYQCTEQSSSGSDGVCNKCACPAAWATGSCPTTGVKSCKECPKTDPYTVTKFNLESCEGGYKKENNACTQCEAGTYAPAGSTDCSDCQKGSYSSSAGASSCTYCPAGYEPSGKTGTTSQSEACKACGHGYYKTGANANSCTQCPNGQTTKNTASTAASDCYTACMPPNCNSGTNCKDSSGAAAACTMAGSLSDGVATYSECTSTNCDSEGYKKGYRAKSCKTDKVGWTLSNGLCNCIVGDEFKYSSCPANATCTTGCNDKGRFDKCNAGFTDMDACYNNDGINYGPPAYWTSANMGVS